MARKPCASSSTTANVVEHEAGALNIDACRVGTFKSTTPSGFDRYNDKLAEQGYRPGSYQKGTPPLPTSEGRWPSNVLLVHRDGCRCEGTRRVKGSATSKTFHDAYEGESTTGFLRGVSHPGNQHADADGLETVESWACEEGCPVAEIDLQSGVLTSGTGAVKRASSAGQEGNRGAAYGAESRPEGTPMISYGDTGGASRFFKNFGGKRA